MTDTHSNADKKNAVNPALGWILFPLSLFPLVALLTYDWRAMSALQSPPAPSTNWIGALGDTFAYYGYLFVGLAIWTVPVLCLAGGIMRVCARRFLTATRTVWIITLLISSACLLQVGQSHMPGVSAFIENQNLANAGGVIGYLLMTRLFVPLLNDFGATIFMTIFAFAALLGIVGVDTLKNLIIATFSWALMKEDPVPDTPDAQAEKAARDAQILAAKRAKEDAKRQRAEEKRLAREEKLRQKAAVRAAKERTELERAAELVAEQDTASSNAAQDEFAAFRAAAQAAKEAAAIEQRGGSAAPHTTKVSTSSERGKIAAVNTPEADEDEEEEVVDNRPYVLPPIDLLNPIPNTAADHGDVTEMSRRLIDTLKIFGIDATLSYTVQGPVVTKYAIELTPGTRYSTVTNISNELMGALHAKSLRIEAPIPGEDRVGIEVPNRKPAGISFREIFESDAWRNSKAELPLLFGKNAAGKELVADLASMPHMLVAGATGQGKSVCLNSLINGLLMTRTPDQLKLIMVDPKSVEFTPYAAIPHLLVPVITDNRKVIFSLHWAVAEMEKRLKLFARARVRNIYDFNHRRLITQTDMFGNDQQINADLPRSVPYIVIIIDEVADLMATNAKDVIPDIGRLTAKARAAGIHLILATQRPDAKVITGTIKANIPGRVAFKTSSAVDSRTILDDAGAENLIGKGDMLFRSKDGLLVRAQGAWISDEEIARITGFIEQHSSTQFDKKFAEKLGRVKEAAVEDPFAENTDDPDNQKTDDDENTSSSAMVKAAEDADLYKRALECVINTQRASTSHFQRRLGIGYNHAARLCDKLEDAGIIGPQRGAGPRQILMTQDQLLAIFNGGDPTATSATASVPDNQSAQPQQTAETQSTFETNDSFTQEEQL